MEEYGYLMILLLVFFLIILIGFMKSRKGNMWILIITIVALVVALRAYAIISYFQLWMIYGTAVTLNYGITFFAAARYQDPADVADPQKFNDQLRGFKVVYCIPVYKEPDFIGRCIESILKSAEHAAKFGIITQIVAVNDASPDEGKTWAAIQKYAGIENVILVNLKENVGKKGALAHAMLGGVTWREAYSKFIKDNNRFPNKDDYQEFLEYLRAAGCNPIETDIFLHTDSDSVIDEKFIYYQALAFASKQELGALSGHCDVFVEENAKVSFVTAMQIPWYETQFRVRKAAESVFNSVFCVSGPGAGIRAEAAYPVILGWVDDQYGSRIYKGATDRMLTLRILEQGYDIEYSYLAHSETIVPENFKQARAQWTRWKQNFMRMFGPVWVYAWRRGPIIGFLTYSRMIVTILAPFIMLEHVFAITLGDYLGSITYISGIMLMGSLMGLSFATRHPAQWKYALLRPLMSVISSFWGSTLTLRAFYLDRKSEFTWRDAQKGQKKGFIINRWWVPAFELRIFTWTFLIILIIWLARFVLDFV